jgi:hypothetical protein
MNNLSSYCGLVNAKIRASDIDLPVICKIAKHSYHLDGEKFIGLFEGY